MSQDLPAEGPISFSETINSRRSWLVKANTPDRVYLVGSKANGDTGLDSDYDLLLVVRDDAPPEQRRSRLAYEVLWGTGVTADVLVCTHSHFESRCRVAASLAGHGAA